MTDTRHANPAPAVPKPASHAAPDGAMIRAEGLTRLYGPFYAVREVSFSIPRGQVVAFLGPNGAGKSTTMKLLAGSLAPSAGRAFIAGIDVQQDRISAARRLGYLPENGPLYNDMTPRALLSFLGEARGLSPQQVRERSEVVIDLCRLGEVVGKPAGKLSKGYRQRVGMAQALLHDPDVLILDEPTAGLDPNQIEQARALLRSLARTKTILLSTHILQEVRAVAQRVLFIDQGRLIHDGPAESLGSDERAMESRFHQMTGFTAAAV